YDERDSWIPDKNLLGQIAKTLQAATTDLDVIEPEMLLEITTVDGEVIRTEPLKMDFDETIDEFWVIDSEQPDPLVLADIRSIKMLSRVTYNRWLGTDNEEELLTVADDPYRKITRTWFGRVFKFSFEGQRSTVLLWWLLIPSLLVTAAALSVLLVHRMTAKQ
ncbi:MAG: hypothetical protein ACI9UA_004417, partial [Pseudoalteromonas tetraodonis]